MTEIENTTETTTPDVAAELAAPEDASQYIEQRREDDKAELPPKEDEPQPDPERKKASRNERRRQAREALERENETLRQQLGERSEPKEASRDKFDPRTLDGGAIENSLKLVVNKYGEEKFNEAYRAFVEHVQATGDQAAHERVMSAPDVGEALMEWFDDPRAQGGRELGQNIYNHEIQRALAERDEQIMIAAESKIRAEQFANEHPDYYEVLNMADHFQVPAPMIEMMARSPDGPAIAYFLAKDVWAEDSKGYLAEIENMTDPRQMAYAFGKIETAIRMAKSMTGQQQRTATNAPPPIRPVQGGANPPKDLASLAKSDDSSAYIAARRASR